MSGGAKIKLRLYRGEDGPVAYAPYGRTWRTRSEGGKTVPVGCVDQWVMADDLTAFDHES